MLDKLIDGSVVLFLAGLAAKKFGGTDGMFNTACFQQVVANTFGCRMPGSPVVEMILSRPGIRRDSSAHWQLVK